MKKFYSVFILAAFVALFASIGCNPSTQNTILRDASVSANADAITIETLQGVALILYRVEQEQALAAATDRADATARVAKIRTMWKPMWEAFKIARTMHDSLVMVLSAKVPNDALIQTAVNDDTKQLIKVANELSIARSRVQGGVQ